MKFNKEDLHEMISWGTGAGEHDGLELVEESGWQAHHKFQSQEYVFKHDGKFYTIRKDRSGSEFTDWYYDEWDTDKDGMVECSEVFPTIEYKKTYSTNPKYLVILDLNNKDGWNAWNNNLDYERELGDLVSYYGGSIIK